MYRKLRSRGKEIQTQEHDQLLDSDIDSLDSDKSSVTLVSFPDPAFKLDKGLAHFARNLGLPDLAGKE